MTANIHQTPEWGKFQSCSPLRDKYWLLSSKSGSPVTGGEASALVLRQRLPHGKCWLYCPRGPLFAPAGHSTKTPGTVLSGKTSSGTVLSGKAAPGTLPAGKTSSDKALADLFHQIAGLARAENAVFFRLDPGIADVEMDADGGFKDSPEAIPSAIRLFSSAAASAGLKLRPAHAHYQPESTLILDLTLSEKELLAQMKPKGRYNIKVAQKHGVKITRYDAATCPPEKLKLHVQTFYNLLTQTTSRDGFSGHPLKYYLDMLETLKPAKNPAAITAESHSINITPNSPTAFLYLAEYTDQAAESHSKDQPISGHPLVFHPQTVAGIIVTHYKDTAIYYFGASGNAHRNVMAPYLLQWQAILDAKAAGLKYYDFLGIAPLKNNAAHVTAAHAASPHSAPARTSAPAQSDRQDFDPVHPWAKVTDFKLKFGSRRVNYMPAFEIVFQPFWYRMILITKTLKGLLKR